MHRPRRTSEFTEYRDDSEISTGAAPPRRQTRQVQRQTVACTPQPRGTTKLNTRQSRLRPPSLERERVSVISVPQTTSKSVGGSGMRITPKLFTTPLRTSPSSSTRKSSVQQRVLFSADRGADRGPLHLDKKWIQEQTQRISEYLNEMMTPGSISGIGPDFFTRGPGLRQMSVKQFVGIINYFLQFVCRNRFNIGSNHVEDITNILNKLGYPYPVNRSWLMTPNTQHSFGHVIVLLDFMMAFAPPTPTELQKLTTAENPYEFQLADEGPAMSNASNVVMSPSFGGLDVEFHKQLLNHVAESFELWDKQLTDEFKGKQMHSSDLLIRKLCNTPEGTTPIEDMQRLKLELTQLRKELPPPLPKKDETRVKNLEMEHQKLQIEYNEYVAQQELLQQERNMLEDRKLSNQNELSELNESVAQLQQIVKQQKYDAKEHNQQIEICAQLTHQLEVLQRAKRDLEERDLNQQVLLSRTKKELTDQLEDFNKQMREIRYSGLCSDEVAAGLTLSLHPKREDVEQSIKLLRELSRELEDTLHAQRNRCLQLDKMSVEKSNKLSYQLEPELIKIKAQLNSAYQCLEDFEMNAKLEHVTLTQNLIKLEELEQSQKIKTEELQQLLNKKTSEFELVKQKNEDYMSKAEQDHATLISERERYLDEYNKELNVLETELKQLEVVEKELEKLSQKSNEELNNYKF